MDGRPLSAEPEQGTPATPASRSFSIGQVLTLAIPPAEQVFCSYTDLLDVLGYMLNDVPAASDIDDAIDLCRPAVQAAYPELAAADPPAPDASDTAVLAWLSEQETRHGAELTLTPLEESS